MAAAVALASSPPPDAIQPAPIRVLIVDDSVVMRAIFNRTLAGCADVEIVGQVATARAAIDCLRAAGADVILLDLEMPGMDGFAALPLLIGAGGGARVLVVSSGATGEAGERARSLGADDTLPKPQGLDYAGDFALLLVDGIRRLGRGGALAPYVPPREPEPEARDDRVVVQPGMVGRAGAVPAVVGIAASTGGVLALGQLLGALPASFQTPILITQHLPAPFVPFFAAQLEQGTGRPVLVAESGMPLMPGQILVAPGDAHLTLAKTSTLVHVRLDTAPAPSGCRPSADPMLASLARLFGQRATAVILSGMGRDGAEGAQALFDAGGSVFAQDQASSVVWGMPGAAVRRGLARAVMPPVAIAAALVEATAVEVARWN